MSLSRVISRRTFLAASAVGVGGSFAAPGAVGAAPSVAANSGSGGGAARSTILFFLCGGASHVDMCDPKPRAPREYRGPFETIATSAPGVRFTEHLPLLAKQAHHLAVLNSVGATVNTNDHHGGYYYNLTGHEADVSFRTLGNNRTPFPDDWPYMGCVVAAKRPQHPDLPNAITLPHKPSRAPYTRPGQFAARLGVAYDPLYLQGNIDQPLEFRSPSLVLEGSVSPQRLAARRELLDRVDEQRRHFDRVAPVRDWSAQQERALSMLLSARTTAAFDVAREPQAVRDRYGKTVNAMSLLLARRLVEAGVPFVTVFWMENEKIADKCKSAGGWDTHGNNFHCLSQHLLPEFDRAYSALIADLHERGLLERTLLLQTSEMGRKPLIGDPRSGGVAGAGRDHWTHCLTDLMAGGGLRGGTTYGSSDRFGEYPADKPITPADVAHTVWHAMGIRDLHAQDKQGRPYHLLEQGRPLVELF